MLSTKVVLAVCAPNEEVPGARTKESIRRDVTTAQLKDFQYIEQGKRYQSFLANYALHAVVPFTPPGPTSGLALVGALSFLDRIKKAGVLEQFRNNKSKMHVVFLCPDDYRLYSDLYRSELHGRNDFSSDSIEASRFMN